MSVVRSAAETHGQPEGAAFARLAAGAGRTAHQFGDALGDGEAEAGASVLARCRIVGLFKALEQADEVVGWNACAGVLDFELDEGILLPPFERMAAQRDLAALGKLDRVRQVVDQRLAQALAIAAHFLRRIANVDAEQQSLVDRALADNVGYVANQVVPQLSG